MRQGFRHLLARSVSNPSIIARRAALTAALCATLAACSSTPEQRPDAKLNASQEPEALAALEQAPAPPPFCPEGTQEIKQARYRWCKQGDQLQGPFHVLDESGALVLEGQFEGGQMVGDWTAYWQADKPRWRATFINNQEEGAVVAWYPSGQKRSEIIYAQGKINGKASYWSEQGTLAAQTEYAQGKPTGTWTYWHADGQQKAHELTWKSNGKEGIHYHWSPQGKKTISPNGRLSKAQLEPTLEPLGQLVLDCYRHARHVDPSAGKLVAQFAVDYSGDVSLVSVLESDFKHPFLGKCAKRYIENLRFVDNPYGRATIIRSWELSVN